MATVAKGEDQLPRRPISMEEDATARDRVA